MGAVSVRDGPGVDQYLACHDIPVAVSEKSGWTSETHAKSQESCQAEGQRDNQLDLGILFAGLHKLVSTAIAAFLPLPRAIQNAFHGALRGGWGVLLLFDKDFHLHQHQLTRWKIFASKLLLLFNTRWGLLH